MWKDGTSLCDVTVTLILLEKIGNIFFLKWNIFLYTKTERKHFYPKIHTGAQSLTQRPELNAQLLLQVLHDFYETS